MYVFNQAVWILVKYKYRAVGIFYNDADDGAVLLFIKSGPAAKMKFLHQQRTI